LLFLEGEAGIGKTRLVEDFVSAIEQESRVLVLTGQARPGCFAPGSAHSPGPLGQALVERFGSIGLESALRPLIQVTQRLVPAFAAWLDGRPAPAGADPLTPDALHALFCEALRSLAEHRPVLLCIEDLH